MHPAHVNLSHRETTPNTYVVDIETQKTTDLLGSLSNCYRAHEKETRISDLLAKAITFYIVDRDEEILTDALREYREHRNPDGYSPE